MKFLIKKAVLLSLSLVLIFVISGFLIKMKSFDLPFLFSGKGAIWIYIDRPFIPKAQLEGEGILYRKSFHVEHIPSPSTLTICTLGLSEVFIDGNLLHPAEVKLSRWKVNQIFDLNGLLAPGQHEILIRVFNKSGPAALLAYSDPIKLFSGLGWEASHGDLLWTSAVPADIRKMPELAGHFVSTDQAIISLLPLHVSVFFTVLVLTWITSSHWKWTQEHIRNIIPSSSNIRWLLIVLWAILGINNIFKVPLSIGMDRLQHYEYIEYVANFWRIPLATQGWQMFQSPFYYIVSALLQYPFSQWFDITTVRLLLRIIPLFCGLLQVELAYRAARSVFPLRQDLQIWGTIIGGLLPMNLYISQVVGNEPLSGLISASAVVMGFVLLNSEREILPDRYFIYLGTLLGLALLTKVTAVLLVPFAVILVIYILNKRNQSLRYIVLRVSLVSGIIFVIAGWYYIRNWIELGRPFVGGWESSGWWQDPGYRTVLDFLSFGRSLSAPIYSSVNGFWDSIYSTLWLDGNLSGKWQYEGRPPWNYDFMLSGALLSLVPTTGILMGILLTISRPLQRSYRAQFFSVCSIGIYFAALLYLYITVPIFSTAKATYTLGLIPCYAILCVTGLDYLSKNNLLRGVINACLACWAVTSYCSYFVL
jgi:4-amino-4-deoxy-L-arabinose transferase-like glycosyltransferase